jgi:spore germination protein YaaH
VKFSRSIYTSLIFVLFATLFSLPPASSDEVARKILTGWMPYYSTSRSLASIETNTAYIQEVMPFWYTMKYNPTSKKMRITDLYTPFVGSKGAKPSVVIDSLTALGIKAIPTITDGTEENVLSGLMADPKSRAEMVTLITALVVNNNFAGIDLDFEGFAFTDKSSTWKKTAVAWVALVKDLSKSLRAKNKLLSVSTPYVWNPTEARKGYYFYEWAKIGPYIDRLRFMGYDYSVARPGPIGPLAWTEKTIQYAVTAMPSSKVYLGLPGYVRNWITAVDGVCPANVAKVYKVNARTEHPMSWVRDNRGPLGFVPQYNEEHQEMTFNYQRQYNGQTATGLSTSCTVKRTVWYQDQRALTVRAALVTKYKLAGIAMWTLGMEDENAYDGIKQVAQSLAQSKVKATLSVDQSAINYGEKLTLTGTLTIKENQPVKQEPVEIQRYSQSNNAWETIASATTDENGTFSKEIYLGQNSRVRIASKESEFLTDSESNEIDISISRLLLLSAPTSVRQGESITVTGSIRPRVEANMIKLESFSDGKWVALGAPAPTDSRGEFSIVIKNAKRGVLTLRVSAAAKDLYPVTTSPQFSILIRGPFSPELVK